MIVSIFSVIDGILISYEANIATGGTIVLVLVMTFLAALATKKLKKRTAKLTGVKEVEA
jgi:ABC-type Mn2+/Zn2+ transport system permease subunit